MKKQGKIQRISDEALISALLALAKRLGHQPTVHEFVAQSGHGDYLIYRRFGSWRAFVEAAGLKYVHQHPTKILTESEVKADLERVQRELGRPPGVKDYERLGSYALSVLYRLAPERRWWSVLVYFLGVEAEEARKIGARGGAGYRTNEERLEELRALARKLGRTPPYEEARANGIDASKLMKRFGGWLKAVEAAGLPKPLSEHQPGRHLTPDELAREVRRVAHVVGHFPSIREFKQHSDVGHGTVARRLGDGKWSSVRALFTARGPAEMKPVADPVREVLKGASVEAVREFFKQK